MEQAVWQEKGLRFIEKTGQLLMTSAVFNIKKGGNL